MSSSPVSQRPLPGGDELYVARPDEERLVVRALDLGLNIALVGPAGAGKTTLLNQTLNSAGVDREGVVKVDCGHLRPRQVLQAIASGFGWSPSAYRWAPKPGWEVAFGGMMSVTHDRVPVEPDPDAIDDGDIDWLINEARDFVHTRLTELGAATDTLLVILDDPPADALTAIFGKHRDRLWDLPLQWVAVTRTTLSSEAALFFEATVHLGDLTATQAHELLERRLAAAGASARALIGTIVDGVPLRPRELVVAARDGLLFEDDAVDRFRAHGILIDRAARLGRTHAMLMSELLALGGTYGSDETLQRRLGYSRSQIVRILNDLAGDGLVVSARDGRRIRFVPNESVE